MLKIGDYVSVALDDWLYLEDCLIEEVLPDNRFKVRSKSGRIFTVDRSQIEL